MPQDKRITTIRSTNIQIINALLFGGMLVSFPVKALEIEYGLNASSEYSDNALRSPADPISERQDTYGVGLQANHDGEKVNFSANYALSYTTFNEDSQRDRDSKNGRSRLTLGEDTDTFNLSLAHSTQLTLQSPTASQILENTRERTIYSISPSLNLNFSARDSVVLGGQLQRVEIEEQTERNSEVVGFSGIWRHELSRVSQFDLELNQDDVEFELFPSANYQLRGVLLRYSAALRNIRYSVGGGYDVSTSEGGDREDFSGATYDISLTYNGGYSNLGISSIREISDTSQGSGNRSSIAANEDDGLGASFSDIDQIKLTETEIFWRYENVCERCDLRVALQHVDETYRNLFDLDNEQFRVSANFDFQINRRHAILLAWRKTKREFESLPDQSFDVDNIRFSYNFQIRPAFFLRIFATQNVRKTLVRSSVEENRFGLSLDYEF